MTQEASNGETQAYVDPVAIGDILNGEPVYGPPVPEELERQHLAKLVALEDEIDDLQATRAAVAEEIQAGRGDDNTREKLRHVTDALLDAQSESYRLHQG